MEIVAHWKKPFNWVVSFHENGLVDTSKYGEGLKQSFSLPIFRAKLKLEEYHFNNTGTSFIFSLVETNEEATLRTLKGESFCEFSMTDKHALPLLMCIANKNTSAYTHHEDGSIEGIFTFQKAGKSINIVPYARRIDESNTDITLT